ncbi:unnamed protein product [Pieris brassicae]|uniref:Aldehyde oxidase/xanthine dehydrogenase second molybdopterin binding domain-containing protein n=1 Tax=Pieris brassicae TaxID=7116 RepID=A0A9P0TY28_PIEBR|nr:unnamed protein product [Pieris brassicae]
METQSCVTKPSDDSFDELAASQFPDMIHRFRLYASNKVGMLEEVNVTIPRCGGVYGSKITRVGLVATASLDLLWIFKKIYESSEKDYPPMCSMRSLQGMTEYVLERISYELDIVPLEVCLSNLNPEFIDVKDILETLLKNSEYIERKKDVMKFNSENRWKKEANYQVTTADQDPIRSAGVSHAEVELDIITGESLVLRVDLVEDIGTSINPEIDVGQIEGAFIMGPGYWTSEHIFYDKETGQILTDRTWTYHIPQAKDIPIDFRIQLRRNHNRVATLRAREGPYTLEANVKRQCKFRGVSIKIDFLHVI